MDNLKLALLGLLLELRRTLGGASASKQLGGTAGSYLNNMLNWLARELNVASPLGEDGRKHGEGRRPTEESLNFVITTALQMDHESRLNLALAAKVNDYREVKDFPNPDAVLRKAATIDDWRNLFRELVRRAYPPKSSGAPHPNPTWLSLPDRNGHPFPESPGLLLRADSEVVTFHGREKELKDLDAWCNAESPFAVRCYTGPGGMGKTRLGLELCRKMRHEGWQSGLLKPKDLPSDLQAQLNPRSKGCPLLVVADYAEHHSGAVLELIRCGAKTTNRILRVVLLARSAGEWWKLAHDDPEVGRALERYCPGGPIELRPLAMTVQERKVSLGVAATDFARKLGKAIPKLVPVDLAAPYFSKILLLHMAALLAVEGESGSGEYGILDKILRRERWFWRSHGGGLGIPAPLLRIIGRAVCVFTANGGAASCEDAARMLRGVRGFSDQREADLQSVALLLHECFPGEQWIEPLQPDRLGDRLVEIETDRDPDVFAKWVIK